jgi:hypothetical protein
MDVLSQGNGPQKVDHGSKNRELYKFNPMAITVKI